MAANGGSAQSRVPYRLGDFTTRPRILLISLLALPIGALAAVVAFALLKLIGLITNLVFYQRVAFGLVAPGAEPHAWWLIIGAPVIGGLIVGLMARYGSEAIRGHGMPEAIEAILRRGSRIRPRVAALKPISSAITIGTGGPFGAEGPIIMTGGAFGSLMAQFLSLTADERKTLLISGAAAGMAATFNAPLASILLAVELLLFELRPRSFVPVTVAVLTATMLRWPMLGDAALFATEHVLPALQTTDLLLCVLAGFVGGVVAWVATVLVYLSEDTFRKLPIHWMWWPAIGGLIIGIGGLFEPRALGVGYDVIGTLLAGNATLDLIIGILTVKTVIWGLSLGSGTSGGVLAPVFMIGASLGALMAYVFPPVAPGFWALMCLAAVVGGVMRSPLTGIIFALELTHQWDALFPLIIASTSAFVFSVLTLKRSVLTEKVVRRGTHLTREYSVDPLEVFLVREVMPRNFVSFRSGTRLQDAAREAAGNWHGAGRRKLEHGQRLYPVLDKDNWLVGLITRHQLLDAALELDLAPNTPIDDIMVRDPVVGYPDMTLLELTNFMTENEISSLPIVDRSDTRQIHSIMALEHVLHARRLDIYEERKAERVLSLPRVFSSRSGRLLIRGRARARDADPPQP
ncbi:MAG: chloride channel protein [Salinisphaera sp.]|nr:chloride channel protein [Salinisphaera sp.]